MPSGITDSPATAELRDTMAAIHEQSIRSQMDIMEMTHSQKQQQNEVQSARASVDEADKNVNQAAQSIKMQG